MNSSIQIYVSKTLNSMVPIHKMRLLCLDPVVGFTSDVVLHQPSTGRLFCFTPKVKLDVNVPTSSRSATNNRRFVLVDT
ncbi:hypothetical protein M8C21_003485, partial [Ambrosia artemisiifolia]